MCGHPDSNASRYATLGIGSVFVIFVQNNQPIKMNRILFTLLICWIGSGASAQFPDIFCEDFTDAGTTWNLNGSAWVIDTNGMAEVGAFWNNRPAVQSISGTNALLLDGDSLVQSGGSTPNTLTALSPSLMLSFDDSQRYAIQFTQYLRKLESGASTRVRFVHNGNETVFELNQLVGANTETGNGDLQLIPLDAAIDPNGGPVEIQFEVSGVIYFWIIDDLKVVVLPNDFGATFPPNLDDTLDVSGYNYAVDTFGGAYLEDQLVIEYENGTTEPEKQNTRDEFGVTVFKSCSCNDDLELWNLPTEITLDDDIWQNGEFDEEGTGYQLENMSFEPTGCLPGYSFGEQMIDKCNDATWQVNNFVERNFPSGSRMLIAQGLQPQAVITQSNPISAGGETYLLSFYARALQPTVLTTFDVIDNGSTSETVTLHTTPTWERYYLVLNAPAAGLWTVTFTEFAGSSFALDGIRLQRMSNAGGIYLPINGNKEKAKNKMVVKEADPNYIVFDQFHTPAFTPAPGDPSPSNNIPLTPNDAVVVAVLDTGVDYNHSNDFTGLTSLTNRIVNRADNCVPNDDYGYDLINEDVLAYDDDPLGHGTHVAGIVLRTLDQLSSNTNCNYALLPLKTHDANGIGTLFTVSCGISTALERDARVINASWGYYGDTSRILENRIIDARTDHVIVVNSAGNDSVDIRTRAHWPGSFSYDNLLVVAAFDVGSGLVGDFSNFGPELVRYATPGVQISSTISTYADGQITPPGQTIDGLTAKDGTSMAAPFLTGTVAAALCNRSNDPLTIRNFLDCLSTPGTLPGISLGGQTLTPAGANQNWNACVAVLPNRNLQTEHSVVVYPNPASNDLFLDLSAFTHREIDYRIVGTRGTTVQSGVIQNFGDQRIEVRSLPAGIYHVYLRGVNEFATVRFVRW